MNAEEREKQRDNDRIQHGRREEKGHDRTERHTPLEQASRDRHGGTGAEGSERPQSGSQEVLHPGQFVGEVVPHPRRGEVLCQQADQEGNGHEDQDQFASDHQEKSTGRDKIIQLEHGQRLLYL